MKTTFLLLLVNFFVPLFDLQAGIHPVSDWGRISRRIPAPVVELAHQTLLSHAPLRSCAQSQAGYPLALDHSSRAGSQDREKDGDFKRNVFFYHLFDVVINDFTLSYERISRSGLVGVRIPLSAGYNVENEDNENDIKNLVYTGIGLNFYPTGQGKWKYFMGPNLRLGLGKIYSYVYDDGNWPQYEIKMKESEFFYVKLLVDNGVMFMPVKSFCFEIIGGLGVRYFDLPGSEEAGVRSTAHFSVNLGYRF
jgi:hypothetical protein